MSKHCSQQSGGQCRGGYCLGRRDAVHQHPCLYNQHTKANKGGCDGAGRRRESVQSSWQRGSSRWAMTWLRVSWGCSWAPSPSLSRARLPNLPSWPVRWIGKTSSKISSKCVSLSGNNVSAPQPGSAALLAHGLVSFLRCQRSVRLFLVFLSWSFVTTLFYSKGMSPQQCL